MPRLLTREEAVSIANRELECLRKIVAEPDADFKARKLCGKADMLYTVLGVSPVVMPPPGSKNTCSTVSRLRTMKEAYPWISLEKVGAGRHLLNYKVMCTYCHGSGAKAGVMSLEKAVLAKHGASEVHARNVALQAARQLDLGEAIAKAADAHAIELTSRTLAVASFVAAGVPHSKTTIFSPAFVHALSTMSSGMASRTHVRETELPDAVDAVKKKIKLLLADKQFSLVVDGGSSMLALGSKVLAVLASTPALDREVLLHLELMDRHETAETQAAVLQRVLESYEFKPAQVEHIAADNASVNAATIAILKDNGWRATYARCLPHCLNLVFKAFLGVFEATYNITTLLRSIRAFINAGGSASRKRIVVEYGITQSGIDFADTRWTSLVQAIIYLASMQTPAELARARAQLEKSTAAGDASAAAALLEADKPELHWNAVYEVMEEETLSKYDGDDLEVAASRERSLAMLSNVELFGAFALLADVLNNVPPLFAMVQGNARFDITDSASTITTKVTSALAAIKCIRTNSTLLDRAMRKANDAMEKQQELVLARAAVYGEAIVPGKETYDAGDLPATREACAANRASACRALKKTLVAALKAVSDCAGAEKLEECLQQLRVRDRFNLNVAAEEMAAADDPMDFLDAHSTLGASPSVAAAATLGEEWKQSCSARSAATGRTYTPQATLKYWVDAALRWKHLSAVAVHHWTRPISSAAAERVFSLLTHMDDARRQRMSEQSLHNTLFLRANRHLVDEVLQHHYDRYHAHEVERDISATRKRSRDAAAADIAAAAAQLRALGTAVGAEDEESELGDSE